MNHGLDTGGVSRKKPPFGRRILVLAVAGLATAVWGRAESTHTATTSNPFLESGADDPGWPFLRGPNYDGHSPEIHLADAWPAKGPPVLWTRPLGQGYSGFVAWDGRVATQYQTLAGQFVVCLDADSGETIWRRVLSSGYDEHSAWPIYSEPYLWISGPFRSGSELLELTDDPSHPINSVRKSRVMSNDVTSSVLVDGAVYGFDLREAQAKTHRPSRGQFRCVDFLSGDEYWATGDKRQRRIDADRSVDVGESCIPRTPGARAANAARRCPWFKSSRPD